MKKFLMLGILPLLIGCAGGIGTTKIDGNVTKTNYTLKDGDLLNVYYQGTSKVDCYSTERYHNEQIYDNSRYWTNGTFAVRISYWEMGLDVTVSEENKSDLNFVYRGEITITLYCAGAHSSTEEIPESPVE